MKFKALPLLFLFLSQSAVSAPVWTNSHVDRVFAGYPDNSIVFMPTETVRNPAGCSNATAYAIQADHDVENAMTVIMWAKVNNAKVYFSVRDDVCHTVQGTDVQGVTVPVIQRIGT